MDLKVIDKNILNKYRCKMDGIKRLYFVDLSNSDYDLRHSNLFSFKLDSFEKNDVPWQKFIIELVTYLSDYCNLFLFKPDWGEASIFTALSIKSSNETKIKEGLFLNWNVVNYNLYKFIRDLILFSKVSLKNFEWLILKAPKAEPQEIKHLIEKRMKEFVKTELLNDGHSEEEIKEMYACIHTVNLRLFEYTHTSYSNLYLISDKTTLQAIISRFIEKAKTNKNISKEKLQKIGFYLGLYYSMFIRIIEALRVASWWMDNKC